MYQSLKEFYDSAEFFPVGKIVPRHILKVDRKISHRFKFGSDTWFVRLPKGHLLVGDNVRPNTHHCIIRAVDDFKFNPMKPLKLRLCPYLSGGKTAFLLTGFYKLNDPVSDPYASDVKLLSAINEAVASLS